MPRVVQTKDASPTLLAQILIERYGLDGRRPVSIGDVAKRHGLTPLTVRLLERPLVDKIKSVIERERAS